VQEPHVFVEPPVRLQALRHGRPQVLPIFFKRNWPPSPVPTLWNRWHLATTMRAASPIHWMSLSRATGTTTLKSRNGRTPKSPTGGRCSRAAATISSWRAAFFFVMAAGVLT
jgi:hypothetical protein